MGMSVEGKAMRWTVVVGMFAVLAFVALALGGPAVGHAGEMATAKGVKIDSSRIYLGNERNFKAPAVVDVDRVYEEIEEYKKIRDENIGRDDPKYMIYMKRATRKFRLAVQKAARALGKDLVGGLGAIELDGEEVPEITDDVISYLP
jgi:hypothetical protein